MDARKRKRIFKSPFPVNQFFSTKYLQLCFCLFALYILLYRGISCGPFRPTPLVPKLAVFSSSVSNSVQELTTHHITNRAILNGGGSGDGKKPVELRVENRVVFPDHVLVILSTRQQGPPLRQRIDCVYNNRLDDRSMGEESLIHSMLSADEYGDDRWIIQCPSPPANYSTVVGLRGHRDDAIGFEWMAGMRDSNMTAQLWNMLAYEAVVEGEDTAVVFVKGLRLKSDRESNASYFNCHFRNWSSPDKDVELTTMAITAAQEVIRCPLPPPVKQKLRNNEDVQITVERTRLHQVIPSIARLSKTNLKENNNNKYKYELCACSMVWNQAGFIKEWIAYHAWLGVQRWFIYDNNSDDGLKEVIDELDSKNYNVTRHVWPWVKSQEAGFSHCVLRARDECRWVGFFDVDEFYYIHPPRNRMAGSPSPGPGALRAIVDNVTSTSPLVGEIRTDCHSFGPSGLKKSPEEGVTLGYTCRMQNSERHKSIVRPEAVDDTLLNQVHHFMLKKEYRRKTLPKRKAVINHYKYQVWDIFKAKFNRRVSTYVVDWQENQNEKSKDRAPGLGTEAIEPSDWHKRFCEVWDTKLRDFILVNLGDPDTGLVPWGSVL
ncbi:glycosyltransferase family 92 protein RCOM_0530710-like [Silene latifolia]|uniref:glycosyltransferase family 92 protein RCOM_0530710-like n=1 Tax=Silene latifolia TaxID=37657 RepID=UPI003D772222